MRHMGFAIKASAFLVILVIVIRLITPIFLVKAFFNSNFPNTSTTMNFYKMEKDSIDVLFLGSSHCVSSFSPQEIYDSHGLRSYNLGTEQQSVLISYYWLKEALQYQHPQVVVLDTYVCFPYKNNPLNSDYAAVGYAVDPMRWSPVKRELIRTICECDESQTKISYYNPLIRFHERWTSLTKEDFTISEALSHDEMKGYSLLSGRGGNENYQPFAADDSVEPEEMVPLMEEYLEKIRALCEENDMELILVKTPYADSGTARYNRMIAYAQEHQLAYYDFNEESLHNEIEFSFSIDNADNGHLNYWGAQKVSHKMAEILASERHGVPSVYDEQWENSRDFYETIAHNAERAQ